MPAGLVKRACKFKVWKLKVGKDAQGWIKTHPQNSLLGVCSTFSDFFFFFNMKFLPFLHFKIVYLCEMQWERNDGQHWARPSQEPAISSWFPTWVAAMQALPGSWTGSRNPRCSALTCRLPKRWFMPLHHNAWHRFKIS